MRAWKSLLWLLGGWTLMMAGVLVLLDSAIPARPEPRSPTRLGAQALVGSAVALLGWWLRRRALRPPG